MADLLHIQIETVCAAASQMFARAGEIEQAAQILLAAVRGLEWYGPNRDYFEAEVEQLSLQTFSMVGDVQNLSARVRRHAELWQGMDMEFAQQFVTTQTVIAAARRDDLK